MRVASASEHSSKETPFRLRCSICCYIVRMGFLLGISAIVGLLSLICRPYSTSMFSRNSEGLLVNSWASPPETTHFAHRYQRPVTCGFANGSKATSADSLAVEAGGLHAKGRLSFKTGVFGEIEPPKALRRALWDKNKNSMPLSLKIVFEVVPTFVPEADETRHRVIRRHAFRVDAENWVQLE
jgi:hypothetical protein